MVISIQREKRKKLQYSKKLVSDIRSLLWIITLGGLGLAFYCIHKGYEGSLPWITGMVSLPWAAHGVVCSYYLNLAKSDHREKGITYEIAMASLNNDTFDADATPEVEQQAI